MARLDKLLVEASLFSSRQAAQAAIRSGRVRYRGRVITKSSFQLEDLQDVSSEGPEHPYVSRGGLKLAHGLDYLGWDPSGLRCADYGASTGGFTDCLLQRGAASVIALDVGHEQLHPSLRCDERVRWLDGVNLRQPPPLRELDLIVLDLSFISLRLILPGLREVLAPAGRALALFKPQFELGPDAIGAGGRVKQPERSLEALADLESRLSEWSLCSAGHTPSPVLGSKAGNQEYLLGMTRLE